jgi:hypothetical protein
MRESLSCKKTDGGFGATVAVFAGAWVGAAVGGAVVLDPAFGVGSVPKLGSALLSRGTGVDVGTGGAELETGTSAMRV